MDAFFNLSEPLFLVFILAFALWSLVWKGLALWRAAKLGQKPWFIAILILNTAGILEIVYLFVIARKEPANTAPSSEVQPMQ